MRLSLGVSKHVLMHLVRKISVAAYPANCLRMKADCSRPSPLVIAMAFIAALAARHSRSSPLIAILALAPGRKLSKDDGRWLGS